MPRLGLGAPVIRRAADQWTLLLAVLATLIACATLVGVGALMLTAGQHRALSAAVAAADGTDGSGSADLVTMSTTIDRPADDGPENTAALLAGLEETMRKAVSPYDATVSVWAASPMLYLPSGGDPRVAYVLDADTARDHATLTKGRWPEPSSPGAPVEAVLPANAAAVLGIEPGDNVTLAVTPSHSAGEVAAGIDVVVVGLFETDRSLAWNRDVLAGAGIDSNWDRIAAYGPFLVAPGTYIGADGAVERVTIVADPHLAGNPDPLPGVARTVAGLRDPLLGVLQGRSETVVVNSGLAGLLASSNAEQNLTAGTVLTAVILVVVLGAATLGLVGALLVQRRSSEAALLAERGASRWQVAGGAAIESVALAALATACSLPLALAAYRALVAAPPLRDAWKAATLGATPGITGGLALAVAAGAFAPAVVVAVVAVRDHATRTRRRMIGAVARSGADLLLAGVAVLGYLQLRSHLPGTDAVDPILVAAPILCVVAGSALALRGLPLVSRLAEVRARNGKGLLAPLAGWQVARGRALSGAFLAVLATAATTFGVAYLSTWTTSQQDQADAAVGSDIAVDTPGDVSTGAALARATGGVVVPVAHRTVSIGARLGGAEVVAFDTRRADQVVRGRASGDATWASTTRGLAPETPVDAMTAAGTDTTAVHLVVGGEYDGRSTSDTIVPSTMTVTPTAVLENEWGDRRAIEGRSVVLDGRSHDVPFPAEGAPPLGAGTWSVVAIDLRFGLTVEGGLKPEYNVLVSANVTLAVVGSGAGGGTWNAVAVGSQPPVVPLATSTNGSTIDATVGAAVYRLVWSEAHVVYLGFEPTGEVPVLVSDTLARAAGLGVGDHLSMSVGTSTVDAVVAGTVPYVPGATSGRAVLADFDALSRERLAAGDLTPLTDAWWVANPGPGSVAAVDGEGLRPTITRQSYADRLSSGPLRVELRVALGLLIAAAVVLAIAGAAAQAAAAARARATSAARLRGLGVPRRGILTVGLLEHAIVTSVAVLGGGVVGAVLAWLVGPLLVTGEGGAPPIPPAVAAWNVGAIAAAVLALLVGAIAAGVPAVRASVARATALSLRLGETS